MNIHTKKQKQYFTEVIKLHYEQGYGAKQISRILGLSRPTVSKWLCIFAAEHDAKSVSYPMKKKEQEQLQEQEPRRHPSTEEPEVSDLRSLEKEVARLQVQLKVERLRADAYDEMIRVAESRFKIEIRKKAGAKRL